MRQFHTIAIVGAGLIGASIGLAFAPRCGWQGRLIGIGRRQSSLATALARGAIDQCSTDLASGVAGADLVIVCTPVDAIVETVQRAAQACPTALFTDAGSTKAEIVAHLQNSLPAGVQFLGSHPLAGDSKAGPEFARAELFEGRTVVLTPTERTLPEEKAALTDFWRSLGATVLEMSPEEHDRAVAVTSHLPHLLASAIAGSTPEHYFPLIATGWRDTTRVSAGDASLWRQILLANRQPVLDALAEFAALLAEFRQTLEAADAAQLELLLAEAKRKRDAVGS